MKKPPRKKSVQLDPREAARRFLAEAKHDWRPALREAVRLALEAQQKKEGAA